MAGGHIKLEWAHNTKHMNYSVWTTMSAYIRYRMNSRRRNIWFTVSYLSLEAEDCDDETDGCSNAQTHHHWLGVVVAKKTTKICRFGYLYFIDYANYSLSKPQNYRYNNRGLQSVDTGPHVSLWIIMAVSNFLRHSPF